VDHPSFGVSSDAARLGVLSPGNNRGQAFDAQQRTLGSYQQIIKFGTSETLVTWSDLHSPEKDECTPSCNFGTSNQCYPQGPCPGAIQNDGAEGETGAMNMTRSSTPGLVSDALGMLGGVDGDTSLRLGNEHEIELIDRSCGPTSGRWDAPGGGGGEHLVREYFSLQSSATQNVIRPVDLFFG